MPEISGLDPADVARIPGGHMSEIATVYFAVPVGFNHIGDGTEHETYREALKSALKGQEDALHIFEDKKEALTGPGLPFDQTFYVDTRWIIHSTGNDGHVTRFDLIVSRARYDTLDDAAVHLDRLSLEV